MSGRSPTLRLKHAVCVAGIALPQVCHRRWHAGASAATCNVQHSVHVGLLSLS